MNEHVIIVAVVVNADTREQAHKNLLDTLPRPSVTAHLDSWWIAEDDRTDGSDLDSAVFVTPGNQRAAVALLREHNLTPGHNLPTDDGHIITSAEFGASVLVRVTYNRDAEGAWVDDDDYTNFTLHGPFASDAEAQEWIAAYPDGDRDLKDIDTIPLNSVRPGR